MDPIIPYLTFNGEAKNAMEFYAHVFDGEIIASQTFAEAPMEIAPEYKDRIMHTILKAGNLEIMASDGKPGEPVQSGYNISLSVNFKSEEAIRNKFELLSAGGQVTMPLEVTFWNATFGMCVDKFGITWMLNYDHV